MILYFIIGKRKSGTSLLFNSAAGVWKPALKDRSWNEVFQQVNEFIDSGNSLGLIAKADALMNISQILQISGRFPFIRFVVVDRNIKQRFRSFVYHRAKSSPDLAEDILGFYHEERSYSENIARIKEYVSISYDDLIIGRDNEFLAEVAYVRSERFYNASRSDWLLYGAIRNLANSSYYDKVHHWRVIRAVKNFYFERFALRAKRPYHTIYTNDIDHARYIFEELVEFIRPISEKGVARAKLNVFLNSFLNKPSFVVIKKDKHFEIFSGTSKSILDDKNLAIFYNENC